eukprot:COSAG06_NODE_1859_length_8205_cov_15.172095_7_plen_131_part_00
MSVPSLSWVTDHSSTTKARFSLTADYALPALGASAREVVPSGAVATAAAAAAAAVLALLLRCRRRIIRVVAPFCSAAAQFKDVGVPVVTSPGVHHSATGAALVPAPFKISMTACQIQTGWSPRSERSFER